MVSELPRSYAAAVTMNTRAGEGNSNINHVNQNATNQNSSQQSEEFDDPYYLHVTENPNLILVSPTLYEINYNSWSRSMRVALEIKNKYGFVDGSLPCPGVLDPKYGVWMRCNKIVCSWIMKSLNSTIAENILYFDIASNNEIFTNVQGDKSVNQYFTKCNALWGHMNAMRPLPTCECVPRCSCTLMSKILKEKQDDQVIRFLEGLNDEYESIKSGVLVMDLIPSMEKVLNMTLKIERKLNGAVSQKAAELIQSNAVETSQNQFTDEQSIAACSVGDIGLTADQFQRLVVLLQNQNQAGQSSSTNAAVTMNNTGMRTDFRNNYKGSNEGKFISNLHINCEIDAIWILDSGATDHIACSLDYFESHHKVFGLSVRLPNGENVNVTHNFYSYVETQFATKIKVVRTENGSEFMMNSFCNDKGVVHQRSCVYTPQQNGIAERKHQHILNVAMALRFQSGLSMEFCGHCVLHASYLINRLPTATVGNKTPFEMLFGKDVNYDQMKAFGCLCYGSTISQGRNKMQSRARKCIFLGIPANIKGYILYDSTSQEVFVSRDVQFYEQVYPLKESHSTDNPKAPEIEMFNPTLPLVPISTEIDITPL
ncbi:PREDICTED: uncharacterized protein LOC109172955 [Ipomoea nil]|uniref:uncharacterized protein LOC109172955 n=1 Tax=Ipomoea nil TaxID=35883 RepID=UPI0009017F01|nr:PREDICTED: uncharacterized protein LOC109172955 [Ipomoea nil]